MREGIDAQGTAARDTSRIIRLLTLLGEPASLDLLLDRVLSTLSELFSSDIVALVDPAGTGGFSPLAAVGLPEELLGRPLSEAPGGNILHVMRTRVPIVCLRASSDPLVDAHIRNLGAETAVGLPVVGSRDARGALLLARCRPAPFSDADVALLLTMAYRIGLALEHAQRSLQLEQIEHYGREVGCHLEESEVVARAVDAFGPIMGADAAVLAVKNADDSFTCAARRGIDPEWGSLCARVSSLLASRCAQGPLNLSDVQEELDGEMEGRLRGGPVHALLVVALLRNERTHGLLFALRFSATQFTPGSSQMATLFAGQTSAALENCRLYQEIRSELLERMRLEGEREQLQARLHLAEKMEAIGTFAGGIAHDFNNLLFAILGNLEISQRDLEKGSPARQAVERAFDASVQAADLIGTFMTFAAGGNRAFEKVETRAFVTSAVSVSVLRSRADVEYSLPEDLWDVEVDRAQMSQAIGAIVTNAAESMPGGGTVDITAENVVIDPVLPAAGRGIPPGKYVVISLADHGGGIAPEHLAKIFDPYFSTKERGATKGTGLGLTAALSIVTRHRGYLRVQSPPGLGTRFSLWLPAAGDIPR